MDPSLTAMQRASWIAKEGWPFVAIGLVAALIGWAFAVALLVWVGLLWSLATALFFRNPPRNVPTESGLIVSPGDGQVIAIESVDDPYFARGMMQRISIFLSVLNVHINRAPFAGVVEGAKYIPGKFLVAYAPKASTINERNAIWIRGTQPGEEAVVVQIAGTIARRIVSYLRPGAQVERGMRYGLIRFGSRVDLFLPQHVVLAVQVGDRVMGGTSVIGRFPTKETL